MPPLPLAHTIAREGRRARSLRAGDGWGLLVCLLFLAVAGCSNNPYGPMPSTYPPAAGYPLQAGQAATGPQSVFAQQQTAPQVVELQRRAVVLDENNRQLTTQLAQAQQQLEAFRQRGDLLAKQLQDATEQNKQLLASAQQYAEQARGMQASMSARGGAKLTANNSIAASASGLQIAGARVIPDGDLIRIRIPADQLFNGGTATLNPASAGILDQVASALTARYARQRVGVEGHTDAAQPSMGAYTTPFQLAGAQAQAVLDQLVQRSGVPMQQLFVIAHGPNHPLADNQSPAGRAENRRIELVIYPDTF